MISLLIAGLLAALAPVAIERDMPKVVTIVVDHHMGSGAYVSPSGTVLTCAHLFRDVKAGTIAVKSHSGAISRAVLVRIDWTHDLAVLQTFPVKRVPYFRLGREPSLGDAVLTYGAPLGVIGTVTRGYIENLNVGDDHFTVQGAPINPGNSGGPLVNVYGRLIGVNVSMDMLNFLVPAAGMGNAVNLTYIRAILED